MNQRSGFTLIELLVVTPRTPRGRSKQAFTLIELLVVIAIIAILSIVVVLTLAPQEILRQSRDATRLSDLDTLNRALGLYVTDFATQGGVLNLGNASTVYVSLIDNASGTCGSLGLPALPTGYTYHCASATSSRNTDTTGWIPVNLKAVTTGSPLGSLPQDPTNSSSTGLYYAYVTSGSQYILTSLLESQKYKTQYGQSPQLPMYPEVLAQGSNLTLSPLFSPNGLVGYWPLDEGTGTVANDQSGNGNGGTWSGSLINGSHYATGKIGIGAGAFNGGNNWIDIGSSSIVNITGDVTVSLWAYLPVYSVQMELVGTGLAGNNGDCPYCIDYYTNNIIFYMGNGVTRLQWAITSPPTSQWAHFVAVRSGATFQWYLNGVANGLLQTVTVTPSSTYNLVIGAYGTHQAPFSGFIDDVRIYNRALSASEIQALYNAEK